MFAGIENRNWLIREAALIGVFLTGSPGVSRVERQEADALTLHLRGDGRIIWHAGALQREETCSELAHFRN